MSKTSRKSLPTIVLALCLLIAQAAALLQSSNAGVAHAAVGPAIYVNPATNTQGVAQIVSVRGTGFTPNSSVVITFNASYSTDGSPLSPRSIPPAVNRAGDNRPTPPTSLGAAANYPNAITLLANTDANGNLVTSNGTFGTVQINIPQTAVDGVYEVVAGDVASGALAATQYTVQRSPNQQLTATPVSGSSVQINGLIQVNALPNTFLNGDEVRFSLQDFAASASAGSPNIGSFGSFDTLVAPASPSVPLLIKSCGTNPVTNPPYMLTQCAASINGDLSAQVYLESNPAPDNGRGGPPGSGCGATTAGPCPAGSTPPCILSNLYYDQVFAIVATVTGNTYNLPDNDLGKWVAAGVHIDHGQTAISLSTNQQSTGGTVTVRGTGFGANDAVNLYLVTLPNPNSVSNTCAIVDNGTNFLSGCLLTTVTTDSNGAFTTVVVTNVATGLPGYLIAEDFGPAAVSVSAGGVTVTVAVPCANARLNEAATAAITIGSNPAVGRLTLLTAAGGTSTSAAISATVVFTGTAFTPNEAVDVILTGPQSSPNTQPLPPGSPVGLPGTAGCTAQTIVVVRANAAGVASGSFLVPETCNTTVVINGRINAGAKVAVDAVGEQSGVDDSSTLNIPATSALISPVNGLSQTGAGFTVTLTGDGFAANEPVTFQFGAINPFSGLITAPLLSVSGVADATGHVSIPNQTIGANLNSLTGGGLYTLVARGLNSSFTATVSINLPFLPNNGNLNCPTGNVLPGQPFVVSGSNFAASTSLLATINFSTFQAVSIPTNADGTFAVTFTTPLGTAANSYNLVISGLIATTSGFQEQLRQCTITVGTTSPVVQAVPTSGPIGITVTVTGQGFGPNEPVAVSLQYTSTSPFSGTDVPGTAQIVGNADANGNFSGVFTVKSTVAALIQGAYSLTATGQQTRLVARTPFLVTGGLASPVVTNVFFAEGYTGTTAGGANANFVETISILNANNYTTTYTVTYFLEQVPGAASLSKVVTGSIGANSVVERSVNTDAGLNQKVAVQVTSPAPLSAERIISRSDASGKGLDSSSSLGQQLALQGGAAPFTYYFASGEVQLTNEEYLTILNPNSATATITVNILPQAVISSTTVASVPAITISVPGNSRYTLPIRARLVSSGITQFGMTLSSDQPVAAERVEYYGDGIGSGKYGATTKPAGTSPFRQYIFAATVGTAPSSGGANTSIGTGADISEIDIINPNAPAAGSATVTVSFFDATGKAINSQQVQVDGGTRETVRVNDVVGTQTNAFSAVVTADKNIYVERPQFFGGDPSKGGTFAATAPSGSPAGLTSVAFPYLDLTGPTGAAISQTVFLYNPGATAIQVRGTYATNTQTVAVLYTVGPNSIKTISVNTDAASLPKGPLGAIFQIVSTGPSSSSNNTSVQTGNGDSFVAEAQASSPDFKMVTSDQGTYPTGAATGP